MLLIKILKRKDASSVVVAILVALIVSQLVMVYASNWGSKLAGLPDGQGYYYSFPESGWRGNYLQPFLVALISLFILEAFAWVVILVKGVFLKKK